MLRPIQTIREKVNSVENLLVYKKIIRKLENGNKAVVEYKRYLRIFSEIM